MSSNANAIILTLLLLLALNVIGVVAYALTVKLRIHRKQRNIDAVRAALLDYFHRSGVEVAVDCVMLPGVAGFTAVIESEPMKRFRLSHIIEMTLCEYVRKACGLELSKVYWRFPVMQVSQGNAVGVKNGRDEKKADELSDEYINEGLEHYRHIPKTEVEELSWEQFEKVTTGLPKNVDE